MRVLGVEPETAALATDFELAEGRYPEKGAEISLDEGAAEAVGLVVGDTVRIGTPEGPAEMEVVGLLRIPGSSFGGLAFGLAPLPYAQEIFDEPGNITGIAVEATDDGAVDGLQENLAGMLGEGLRAERSETRTAQVGAQFQSFQTALLFFAGTALFVGAFLVFNALSMTIFERTRELGILRAIGTTRLQISRRIIDEGVVASLIGCLVGTAVGSLLGYLFVRGSGANGFEVAFYYPTVTALLSVLSGLLIGVFAGLLPARSAAHANIVEAVQYE